MYWQDRNWERSQRLVSPGVSGRNEKLTKEHSGELAATCAPWCVSPSTTNSTIGPVYSPGVFQLTFDRRGDHRVARVVRMKVGTERWRLAHPREVARVGDDLWHHALAHHVHARNVVALEDRPDVRHGDAGVGVHAAQRLIERIDRDRCLARELMAGGTIEGVGQERVVVPEADERDTGTRDALQARKDRR